MRTKQAEEYLDTIPFLIKEVENNCICYRYHCFSYNSPGDDNWPCVVKLYPRTVQCCDLQIIQSLIFALKTKEVTTMFQLKRHIKNSLNTIKYFNKFSKEYKMEQKLERIKADF